jgi:hypothetical protein
MWVVLGLARVLVGMGQCPGSVRGEISCELEGASLGEGADWGTGEGEGSRHRSTFDGVVFYMGVCWDGAVP